MKVITRSQREEDVLADVNENADRQTIIDGIVARAEHCVVHLCGCG